MLKNNINSDDFYNSIKKERPLIMGILNVTPDSFSDGGQYLTIKTAVEHAVKLIDEGADIIDIGGESSRPGADPVSYDEEYERVIPVINEILKLKPDAVISVDTTKSGIAEEALKAGALIINDISGLESDPEIIGVCSDYNAVVIIMHMQGNPRTMQVNPEYSDVVNDVLNYLLHRVDEVKNVGVNKIIIDPGIGFGKKLHHNYELLKNLNKFAESGYPLLAGLSRKTFIGKALNLTVNERDNGTIITETYSVINGADIIRTHIVKNAVEMKKLLRYITNPEQLINV